jgi:UDP-N-acetylglucosamine 2-epimerase (non-hydrolysing)
MVAYEALLLQEPTDLCLVVGDVTSTLACSIAAKKLNIKVAHVEAGIRSGDLAMPEEINRLVTDSITDLFFTTTPWAGSNLISAGVPEERIHWVGNTMIDTLLAQRPRFQKPEFWEELGLKDGHYLVMTLHRPSNVDSASNLERLMKTIVESAKGLQIVFPVHPRTRKMMETIHLQAPNLHLVDPMPYLRFNYLVEHAKAVLTDSGGITEETTVMGIPCMTLRNSTERPETVELGTNELLGAEPEAIPPAMEKLLAGKWKKGTIPELWDGQTAERIVAVLEKLAGED